MIIKSALTSLLVKGLITKQGTIKWVILMKQTRGCLHTHKKGSLLYRRINCRGNQRQFWYVFSGNRMECTLPGYLSHLEKEYQSTGEK